MSRDLSFSFEMFPSRDAAGCVQFDETAARLAELAPEFCSVTYGAGGSAREGSEDAVRRLRGLPGLVVAAHLTCVGQSREEIEGIARRWWKSGIRNIVALRGDLADTQAPIRGYRDAADLVAGLCAIGSFDIAVACYPEIHPKSRDQDANLDNLRRKFEAGASKALSQFFFEPEAFLRFRDVASKVGINAPLIPGILPILDFQRVSAFAKRCGASVPAWLAERFAGLENDPEARGQIAASLTVSLCERLIAEGVRSFHFYTLNRPTLTLAVCRTLGLRPRQRAAA
jgi:methylenetetrahydrofolate reductase (NADPH)